MTCGGQGDWRFLPSGRDRESGSVTIELLATVTLLLVAALLVLQVALVGQTALTARTAARAASLAAAQGASFEEVEEAARTALPPNIRSRVEVIEVSGTRVTVSVAIPIVLVALTSDAWGVVRTAEFAPTT